MGRKCQKGGFNWALLLLGKGDGGVGDGLQLFDLG